MKRHIDKIPEAHYERGYVYNLHFHIIWVTKYRNPCFITDELVQEMKQILLTIAEQAEFEIEEIEVMPEHVHLLISFKPKFSITDVIKFLKGHSARIFFLNQPGDQKELVLGRKALVSKLLCRKCGQYEQGNGKTVYPQPV